MPERHGIPQLVIVCDAPTTGRVTTCRATVGCSLYPCARDIPDDVTMMAEWTSDAPAVMRLASPGVLEAVTQGDTVVRAKWTYGGGATSYFRSVSVFAGTPPLPTFEIGGVTYDGSVSPRVPLDGVVIEVLNGVAAGRHATSGVEPPLLPGFNPSFGGVRPGVYRILGVPNGTFRLRASKAGYVPQERDVSGTGFTGADFELQRQ